MGGDFIEKSIKGKIDHDVLTTPNACTHAGFSHSAVKHTTVPKMTNSIPTITFALLSLITIICYFSISTFRSEVNTSKLKLESEAGEHLNSLESRIITLENTLKQTQETEAASNRLVKQQIKELHHGQLKQEKLIKKIDAIEQNILKHQKEDMNMHLEIDAGRTEDMVEQYDVLKHLQEHESKLEELMLKNDEKLRDLEIEVVELENERISDEIIENADVVRKSPEHKPKTTSEPTPNNSILEDSNIISAPTLHPIPACPVKKFGINFPITPIHSFQGSGNTWLRYLIEKSTGFWTGSAFDDKSLFNGGLKGEFTKITDFSKVVGLKVHNPADSKGEKAIYSLVKKSVVSKCVIMIRNPFDTFVAEFTRMVTGKHSTGIWGVEEDEIKKKFKENAETLSFWEKSRWLKSYEGAFRNCMYNFERNGVKTGAEKSVHILFYEQLKSDTVGEMRRLAKYLESYDEERFHNCMEVEDEKVEGNFHRKKHITVNLFEDEVVEAIRGMVMELNETIGVLPASYLVNPYA